MGLPHDWPPYVVQAVASSVRSGSGAGFPSLQLVGGNVALTDFTGSMTAM